MLRRALLGSGIVASLLYVTADVVAAIAYPAYHSFSARVVSELMAAGAPTERLVDPIFVLHGAFVIAFGAGVWMAAEGRRLLHVTACLLVALGVVDLPGPLYFEMNMRGTPGTQNDLLHIAITVVLVSLIFAAIGVAAFTRGRTFRNYSFATLAIMLVSGALTSIEARNLAAGEPTQWVGITERINIGGYLLWQAALALSLLREPRRSRGSASVAGSRQVALLEPEHAAGARVGTARRVRRA